MASTPDYTVCPLCKQSLSPDTGYGEYCCTNGACPMDTIDMPIEVWHTLHDRIAQATREGYEQALEDHANTKSQRGARE